MKKLLSIVALVAMIAVASVASAAPADDVSVSASVGSLLQVDMSAGVADCDGNAPSVSFTADLTDLAILKSAACNFQTSATVNWDLDLTDANDATECDGGVCSGGIAGSTYATTGAVIPVGTGTLAGGTAGVGFYADSADGHADACATAAATCGGLVAGSNMSTDEVPDVDEEWDFTFNVAVDDNPAQYADTYSDAWTVTITAA